MCSIDCPHHDHMVPANCDRALVRRGARKAVPRSREPGVPAVQHMLVRSEDDALGEASTRAALPRGDGTGPADHVPNEATNAIAEIELPWRLFAPGSILVRLPWKRAVRVSSLIRHHDYASSSALAMSAIIGTAVRKMMMNSSMMMPSRERRARRQKRGANCDDC